MKNMYKIVSALVAILICVSCTKNNFYEEPKEEIEKEPPFEIIPRDTISEDIDMFPDF